MITIVHAWSGMQNIFFLIFKAQWQLYVPPALTISNCIFIHVFRMILTVNTDYFLKQR
jgi:hypothetical protein